MSALLAWFTSGLIFGIGLCLSGMINPSTVQSFLDVAGGWNPTLLFVLGGAVLTTFIGYRLVMKRRRPTLAPAFHLPASNAIDGRLLTGAVLFGIGWGLLGYCPGPAIASLSSLHVEPLLFVGAMIVGNLAASRWP